MKLADNFSPITKKLDEVRESNQEVGEIIKKNKAPQLAEKILQPLINQ